MILAPVNQSKKFSVAMTIILLRLLCVQQWWIVSSFLTRTVARQYEGITSRKLEISNRTMREDCANDNHFWRICLVYFSHQQNSLSCTFLIVLGTPWHVEVFWMSCLLGSLTVWLPTCTFIMEMDLQRQINARLKLITLQVKNALWFCYSTQWCPSVPKFPSR